MAWLAGSADLGRAWARQTLHIARSQLAVGYLDWPWLGGLSSTPCISHCPTGQPGHIHMETEKHEKAELGP